MPTIPVYSYLRFSDVVQAKGASRERQKDGAANWLKAKARDKPDEGPYVLDDARNLEDLGISAYRGKNSTTGALSKFLEAVEQGQVDKGSYLLVENLDRLSREQVTIALGLFLSIIGKGITIVTLVDGQEYSQATLQANPYPIIMSIITMIRAHEESATKGLRVADAWARKREAALATGKALTRQCPAWLRVEGGRLLQCRFHRSGHSQTFRNWRLAATFALQSSRFFQLLFFYSGRK
jgi:DNA invertase Pin-like site-specific DNA recombinase